MKEKFLRYFSIFLYEAYIVCLFLPIKFVFGKTEVYGLSALYAIIMGEGLPSTFFVSFLFLIFPLWGLISILSDAKKDWVYYIGFSLGFIHFAFFLVSALFKFGQGFGIGVCAVMSLVFCALNALKIFSPDNTQEVKIEQEAYQEKDFLKSAISFEESFLHNCPNCNKPLYQNEECSCQKSGILN